jgi:hypothetical protein
MAEGRIIRPISDSTASRAERWCLLFGLGRELYDHVGGKQITHIEWWVHARRKLFEVVKLNPESQTRMGSWPRKLDANSYRKTSHANQRTTRCC